jgi:hypothetical protein
MTRINLVKYGFIRFPEEDFSDDGNRFTCYRFSDDGGRNHVSKLVSDGQAYLSCHVEGNLPYDVYSTLSNYRTATWSFNGISVASLTDEMLQDFFRACVAYEKEYRAAEASIEYPSLEALTEKCHRVVSKRLLELSKAENLLTRHVREAALKFSSYEWSRVQDYMKNLEALVKEFNPETRPKVMYGKYTSFNFIRPEYEMDDSYWFKSIIEIFDKYGLK